MLEKVVIHLVRICTNWKNMFRSLKKVRVYKKSSGQHRTSTIERKNTFFEQNQGKLENGIDLMPRYYQIASGCK